MQNYLELRDRVLHLVNGMREKLRSDDVSNMEEDIRCGEWGVAYELLCVQIYEYRIHISQAFYDELMKVGKEMNSQEKYWTRLKELIKNT